MVTTSLQERRIWGLQARAAKPFAGLKEQVNGTGGHWVLSNYAREDDQVAKSVQLGAGKVEPGLGDGGEREAYCDRGQRHAAI